MNILIQIVDENDKPIAANTIDEARAQGLWHRVVRVAVLDKQANILLQKRSFRMEIFPNCWEISASGHVDEGETYEQAALREANEEIGLADINLEEIESYKTTKYADRSMKRFNKTYKVIIDDDKELAHDPHEVGEIKWFTKEQVRSLLDKSPNKLSDGLKHYLKRHYL